MEWALEERPAADFARWRSERADQNFSRLGVFVCDVVDAHVQHGFTPECSNEKPALVFLAIDKFNDVLDGGGPTYLRRLIEALVGVMLKLPYDSAGKPRPILMFPFLGGTLYEELTVVTRAIATCVNILPRLAPMEAVYSVFDRLYRDWRQHLHFGRCLDRLGATGGPSCSTQKSKRSCEQRATWTM
eukprot:TRINITY_DN2872_c0_g1_i11.p1 TRINITY_DN2872_c0_g1~~TRINITY_DN2872_c0_g1_i11.p1  ORF type:complete len:187 (-),score=23.67 TRINITY_DN2872_c0_g1_i11:648-1208(-)